MDETYLHCYCNHTSIFAPTYIEGVEVEDNTFEEAYNSDDIYT
jgi:hypothetical protein